MMYSEFYHLTDEPFLLTPDHRFYYESRVHAQAMAHLMYGVSRGEGFIVITGEVGAGKTTLLNRLCATLDSNDVVAAHIVTTLLSGTELLRMVCSAFNLRDIPHDKDAVLLRLRQHFEGLHKSRRRALLIVDEAQNLSASSIEELRMLSNFQVGSRSLCQMFLIGQPQFRETLAHPNLEQFRQRVIATYHLGPMGAEECGQYLMHRLKHVGWKNDPTFDGAAINEIAVQTGGIPRRINTFCSRLLLLGFLDDIHVFTVGDVLRIAADLREESGTKLRAAISKNGQDENYLDRMEGEGGDLHDRLELLEGRLDHQEQSMRKIVSVLSDVAEVAKQDRD
jgi:general secretion pathway protein A